MKQMKTLVFLITFLMFTFPSSAKRASMHLDGKIDELSGSQEEIRLLFSGKIKFNVQGGKKGFTHLSFDVENFPIESNEWFVACQKNVSEVRDKAHTIEALHKCLEQENQFSLQAWDPKMSFTSDGELKEVEARLSIWGKSIFSNDQSS